MAYKIFIDGKEGTTGLKIFERFEGRSDLQIITIDEDKRKNPIERQKLINESDFTFLCLPDDAAKESVSLCTNPKTKIIDASTAHRINPLWAYGFPELDKSFREKICSSNRVAVPGCYASGFNSICYPLIKEQIIMPDYPVVVHAVSGYSGAGKKAIAQYEDTNKDESLNSPRLYALTQNHKHLPEMKKISGLDYEPIFTPYICSYVQGMSVTISLHKRLLNKKLLPNEVLEIFKTHYKDSFFVQVQDYSQLNEPFIPSNTLANTNKMYIYVYGNEDRIVITSCFDNLGKGASGAAVQCLNIMMGVDETTGLI